MAEARPVERNANALIDDPDWCGHPMVDVQVWCCQTCGRAVTPATRTRMEQAPTVAPAGEVWVLVEGNVQMWADRFPGGARDAHRLVRTVHLRLLRLHPYADLRRAVDGMV